MPWLTIALLLLFGLLFLAAEVIFIPGTTVVGFVGFALLAAACGWATATWAPRWAIMRCWG